MPPTLKAVIFCDDIRREAGNKLSIMGVYTKQLFLQKDTKLPVRLPRLCIYQRWEGLEGNNKFFFHVTKDNQGLEQFRKPIEIPVSTKDPADFTQIVVQLHGFKVDTYGDYHFRTSLETPQNIVDDSVLTIALSKE